LAADPQRALLLFHLAGQAAALPLENVQRIAPMALLARPPGLPSALEGVLNLAGAAVPVVRLDRLLQLPEQRPGLYSMLIVLRGLSADRVALLVDRVSGILYLPESALLPVRGEDSFNACAEAIAAVSGQVIHLLSPARIFLEKERESLSHFQAMSQRRFHEWEQGQP
jgi:purine-binding chemotaxis protein CheW